MTMLVNRRPFLAGTGTGYPGDDGQPRHRTGHRFHGRTPRGTPVEVVRG